MPHKHKRDKGKNDASYYDLPPSKTAQSLPVKIAATTTNNTKPQPKLLKRKHPRLDDDTPRAFTRLRSGYPPPRSGLDDGTRPSKKHTCAYSSTRSKTIVPSLSLPVLTIQSHEPLSSFNARVDAALPLTGLSKRSNGGREVEKGRKTKTERKMQKLQKDWREEERRRKEKLSGEEDEAAIDGRGMSDLLKVAKNGKLIGGKRKRRGTGDSAHMGDDDDPWAHIKAKGTEGNSEKAANGSRGPLIGLHDVVLAPPKWSQALKERENFNIGKVTGGLKRQVKLAEERKNIVENYKQMMRDKRGEDG